MNTQEIINARRSIKHFDASYKISDNEKKQLINLAMLSPTAFNIQNWRYVVVDDIDLRNKIRQAAFGQAQVTDSSLFIILCADLNAWKNEPARYWKNTAKEVTDYMLPAIDNYYRDKPQVQRDEAMRSCGITAQTLMLAAKSMGYDSCPMDGFDFDEVAKLIKLPEDHVIAMFVAIGKATKQAWERAGQLPYDDVVIKNTFN